MGSSPFPLFVVNPLLLWLIAGSLLCLMEAIFPVAFVSLMMGISAIAVALLSQWVKSFGLQVFAWLLLSTLLIVFSRRFLAKPLSVSKIADAVEGETLTAIAAGQTGRVLYEGNSWRAKCDDSKLRVEAHQKVYIAGREGNTLIVYPADDLLDGPLNSSLDADD